MDALFSWTTLTIVVVALLLVPLAIKIFGRINLTFRFRGAVVVSPWAQKPCPHLGQLDEPFVHKDEPDEEHRCYLWMQRDRIDLAHQKGFCLGSAHTHCPWLAIAPPVAKAPLLGRVKEGAAILGAYGWSVASAGAASLAVRLIGRYRELKVEAGLKTDAALPLVAEMVLLVGREIALRSRLAGTALASGSKALAVVSYSKLATATGYAARRSHQGIRHTISRRQPALDGTLIMETAPTVAGATAAAAIEIPGYSYEIPTPVFEPAPTGGSGVPMPSLQPASGNAVLSQVDSLVEQAKVAGMSGNRKLAYGLLSLAIDLDPNNDEAWLWKGSMTDDLNEKATCFRWALAINPTNQRAQQALRQMADRSWVASAPVSTPGSKLTPDAYAMLGDDGHRAAINTPPPQPAPGLRTILSEAFPGDDALIGAALQCLERGDEDEAHRLFVKVTETSPRSEKAWFWRAKTAPDLNEIIESLQQALAINPTNEKVRANLAWAIQRQEKEEAAKEEERVAAIESKKAKAQANPRPNYAAVAFRWLLAVVCLALAGFWVSVAVLQVIETPLVKDAIAQMQGTTELDFEQARPLYEAAGRWLPELNWGSLPYHEKLEVAAGYNLLWAVPYTVGFLYFFVAVGIFKRQSWSRFWGFTVTTFSLGLGLIFSVNSQAVLLLSSLGFAALLMLLVCGSEFKRQPSRIQPTGVSAWR